MKNKWNVMVRFGVTILKVDRGHNPPVLIGAYPNGHFYTFFNGSCNDENSRTTEGVQYNLAANTRGERRVLE